MTQSDDEHERIKNLVQRHWNGRAATFDDESQHGIHTDDQHEQWLKLLGRWTGDDPRRVLDVGCGTGVISLLLAELGHTVIGVDFAPSMLKQAHEKACQTTQSVEFYRGDAEALAVAEDTLELVTARHLIWTLANPTEAIREWQRVLEPGGRVLLIEGYWDHAEPWEEYETIHTDLPMYDGRPPDELRSFLEGEGLREIEQESLMDPVLWGQEPRHDYYLMSAEVPR